MLGKKLVLSLCLVLMGMVGVGCNDSQTVLSLDEQYYAAVSDAVFVEPDEISRDLVAIVPENTYLSWKDDRVLVVTFTKYPDSYPLGAPVATWWGETWVTVVPELQDFFTGQPNLLDNPALRVKQVLGLPQTSGHAWFAEMWVKPEDLFRPCPDDEITDTECEMDFPDNATTEHIDWFNNQIVTSYFVEQKYPWTRVGYTYNWNIFADEVGLSEFVLRQNAEVVVERVENLHDYLAVKNK